MIRTSNSFSAPATAVENAASAAMSNYSVEVSADKVAKALLVAKDRYFEVTFLREGSDTTETARFISVRDKSHKLSLAESEFVMNLESLTAELKVEDTRKQLSVAKSAMRAATTSLDERLNKALTVKKDIQVAELNPDSLVIYDCVGIYEESGKTFTYSRIGGAPEFQAQPDGRVFLTITPKEFLEYFTEPEPEKEPEATAEPEKPATRRRSSARTTK